VVAEGPVLVTGATGFIGRHLVRRLRHDDRSVVGLVRDPRALGEVPGVVVEEIPPDDAALRALVASHRPSACVHLATRFVATVDVDDLRSLVEANVLFGLRVAEACLAADGVPFVDTGTVWQHAGGAPYAPANLYAATKQALHDLLVDLAGRGLPVVTLTLTDTYGPGDPRPKLVPRLLDAARTGVALEMGDGSGQVDLVHVDDVVSGFGTVLDRLADPTHPLRPATDASTVHTLTSGAPCTVRELVAAADRALGRPVPVAWGARAERAVDRRPAAPHDPSLPGWSPAVSLDEGLRRLFGPLRRGLTDGAVGTDGPPDPTTPARPDQ
jgi:nucleoside-diphosphate-sugar epimerase